MIIIWVFSQLGGFGMLLNVLPKLAFQTIYFYWKLVQLNPKLHFSIQII